MQPPGPESLCTICYTSGTTGMPKGVMLTHENVVASMCSVTMQLGEHRPMKNDVMISFLPLAHMLERCCEVCLLSSFIITIFSSTRSGTELERRRGGSVRRGILSYASSALIQDDDDEQGSEYAGSHPKCRKLK